MKRKGRLWGRHFVLLVKAENDYYRVLFYVISNPLRHGLVNDLDELFSYRFCNYKKFFELFGKKSLEDYILEHIKFKVDEDKEESFWRKYLDEGRFPHS